MFNAHTAAMRALYLLLLYLLTPLLLLRLLLRSRQQPAYRERLFERFGKVPRAHGGVAVWVHAVSVGEAQAALPLIEHLIARHGVGRVWVTTTTPTGSDRIISAFGTRVIHTYGPYDMPLAVRRFLDQARPSQVVIMETELWPTLFRHLRERGIPLTIANARLSPVSFKGYARVAGFARSVLSDVSLVAAQSPLDAERFSKLGAPRVSVIGNLKFDIDPPAEQIEAGAALRQRLAADGPVWIAASTHEDEEAAALQAHKEIRQRLPQARLILVPRHPQRFDDVAQAIARAGVAFQRRSELQPDTPLDAEVLFGDSLGEMWMYLAASDAAFVGGSLVPVGGHNVLEPAALGLPVMFGPHMHNFLPARELLLQAGAAQQITEGAAIAAQMMAWLSDPALRTRMGQAGREAVHANRGALTRLIKSLEANEL